MFRSKEAWANSNKNRHCTHPHIPNLKTRKSRNRTGLNGIRRNRENKNNHRKCKTEKQGALPCISQGVPAPEVVSTQNYGKAVVKRETLNFVGDDALLTKGTGIQGGEKQDSPSHDARK